MTFEEWYIVYGVQSGNCKGDMQAAWYAGYVEAGGLYQCTHDIDAIRTAAYQQGVSDSQKEIQDLKDELEQLGYEYQDLQERD